MKDLLLHTRHQLMLSQLPLLNLKLHNSKTKECSPEDEEEKPGKWMGYVMMLECYMVKCFEYKTDFFHFYIHSIIFPLPSLSVKYRRENKREQICQYPSHLDCKVYNVLMLHTHGIINTVRFLLSLICWYSVTPFSCSR